MWLLEIRQACRRLRHEPGFAAAVVCVLGVAVAANSAMFTLVNGILLRPLPMRDPGRLVSIAFVRPGNDRYPLSLPDLMDIRSGARSLSSAVAVFGWSANLTGDGDAERLQGARVSPDYFAVTGAATTLGRPLAPDDEDRPVAVISDGLWRRRFGADPRVIGRGVVLNGSAFTIVGVLRPDFLTLVRDPDVIVPFSAASDPRRVNRAQGFLRVVGRLQAGATVEQASEDLNAIAGRLRREYPDIHGASTAMRVVSLQEDISGRAGPVLRMLMGAVILVLLVAAANLANLFVARAGARRHETALRAALGASRFRLSVQVLIESALLGTAGGVVGLLVGQLLVQGMLTIATDLPRVAEVRLDLRVALFTLALSCATSLFFGLAPGIASSMRWDIREALGQGGRASTGGRRVRGALILVEVALTTLLLTAAALLARSYARVQSVSPGFRTDHVLTLRLSLPRARYATAASIDALYRQVQPRLLAGPGVRAVAASNVIPLNGYLATVAFSVTGADMKGAPEAHYRMISPDYFTALGIDLKRGRAFTEHDDRRAQAVAVVNETFVDHFLGNRDPIGSHIWLEDGGKEPRLVEVVGVVGNVRHFGLDRETTTEIYVPIPQVPDPTTIWLANNMYWELWTEGEPLAAAEPARRIIAAVDPGVPASFVRTMEQWASTSVAERRFNLNLAAAFAALALLLALVGVYGVAAYAVTTRSREIGIRGALGGSRAQLVRLIVAEGMRPVAAGLAIGLIVAVPAGRAVAGLLFGVGPQDALSIASAATAVLMTALAAAYIPAQRAASIDPISALRSE